MKLMFASDIHGSASYCRRMIDAYHRESPERLILLGDLLYHGPRNDLPDGYAPKEVAAMLNALKDQILCVRGNCEAEVDQMMLNFPVFPPYIALFVDGRTLVCTHGHLYTEPLPFGDAIVISGHTHIPMMARTDYGVRLNPGSVSLPKAGSDRGYLIYRDGVFTRKELGGTVLESLSV